MGGRSRSVVCERAETKMDETYELDLRILYTGRRRPKKVYRIQVPSRHNLVHSHKVSKSIVLL